MTPDTLIDDLIDREGGYVDHPADRGGRTCFGITEAVARAHGYDGAMRDLPRATAAATNVRCAGSLRSPRCPAGLSHGQSVSKTSRSPGTDAIASARVGSLR